ncbi:hypothetical protein [Desulfopila inferna]|uniref:hypothetical protein n=1 Tax=Desulfopila inferna TaxID=468528 RepID=UPI001964EE5C|nr:hypothetical protein [Desulfopila inferna]MBM9603219.1 hypothetical protein [Desulfopila inferna]
MGKYELMRLSISNFLVIGVMPARVLIEDGSFYDVILHKRKLQAEENSESRQNSNKKMKSKDYDYSPNRSN